MNKNGMLKLGSSSLLVLTLAGTAAAAPSEQYTVERFGRAGTSDLRMTEVASTFCYLSGIRVPRRTIQKRPFSAGSRQKTRVESSTGLCGPVSVKTATRASFVTRAASPLPVRLRVTLDEHLCRYPRLATSVR